MEEKNFVITEKNVQEYAMKMGKWIKDYIENTKSKGVVLGMSGGVDCSTVAALCKKSGINIYLVLMPYEDNMIRTKNYSDAMELINKFNIKYHEFNIKSAVDSIEISEESDLVRNTDKHNIELSKANIRPRIRMTYLYHYAQINNLLVIGTGNLSERTVGYFTKWGDGACDLNPIGLLTKKEVYILARYLGVPNCIINKKPSADLWEGQTDEQELGIKYEEIDKYILNGSCGNEEVDKDIKMKHERNMHKLKEIPIFNIEK